MKNRTKEMSKASRKKNLIKFKLKLIYEKKVCVFCLNFFCVFFCKKTNLTH